MIQRRDRQTRPLPECGYSLAFHKQAVTSWEGNVVDLQQEARGNDGAIFFGKSFGHRKIEISSDL